MSVLIGGGADVVRFDCVPGIFGDAVGTRMHGCGCDRELEFQYTFIYYFTSFVITDWHKF